jgi:hypothetical protein
MFVTDYTTFPEVRAALGVAEDELENDTLDLPLYSDMLQIELEDIHISLPTVYATTKDLATKTADQLRFLQTAHLFATYAVARQLTTSLPLFSPEQITDGKAVLKRSQETPYQKVIDAVGREYSRFRVRLDQMFAIVNSSTSADKVVKSYFGVISPSVDPIIGT